MHLGSVNFQSPARGMRVDHTPGERPSALGTVTPRMVPTNLRLVCACETVARADKQAVQSGKRKEEPIESWSLERCRLKKGNH